MRFKNSFFFLETLRIALFFDQVFEATVVASEKLTGMLTTASDISIEFLIFTKHRLKSSPQPFESRKSRRSFPSISSRFALNVSLSFRRSMVVIDTELSSSLIFHVQPNLSSTVVNRLIDSSHLVDTKNLVIRLTSLWNGFELTVDP